MYGQLLLWRDVNQDGRSQAEEVTGLEEAGVESISLDLVESARRDSHGNLLRWASKVRMAGTEKLRAVDAILVTDDSAK